MDPTENKICEDDSLPKEEHVIVYADESSQFAGNFTSHNIYLFFVANWL